MALSEKNRELLTEIYASFSQEGEIDEDPELALEYLLKGLIDELAKRRRDGSGTFEMSLSSITYDLGDEREMARVEAETAALEAAEVAKST
jgi:hypothetical protein